MKKLIVLAIVVLAASCGTKRSSVTSSQLTELQKRFDSLVAVKSRIEKVTDTVEIQTVIVDEVETEVEVPIDCDSLGNVRNVDFSSSTGSASFKAMIRDNSLKLMFKQDSLESVLKKRYRDKYVADSTALYQQIKDELSTDSSFEQAIKITRRDWKIIIILILVILGLLAWVLRKRLFTMGR